MNYLDDRFILNMDISNKYNYIVFDTSISNY